MKRRTINQAALEALKREGRPLTIKEIYNKILSDDLYRFNAENPSHIVYVQVRRHCEGIDFPTANQTKHFQILNDGTYWIKDLLIPGQSPTSIKSENATKKDSVTLKVILQELKDIHEKHNLAFKTQMLNQLKSIEPKTFELFAKKLIEAYGFSDVSVTNYVKDGGVDGYGKLKIGMSHLNVAFQCKRWKNAPVSRTEIDKFRGAIQGEYEQGIIFTTSNFTKEALNATRKSGAVPIILIDGLSMVEILIDKKFGVDHENVPVYINALDRVLSEDD